MLSYLLPAPPLQTPGFFTSTDVERTGLWWPPNLTTNSHILIIFIPTYNCNNQHTYIHTYIHIDNRRSWYLYIFYPYFIHFVCTADYDVSILTRACCSWTHFFPQLPKEINPVVLHPDIDPDEVSRDNTITEEFVSHPHCRICRMHRGHILQPQVLFVSFQQGCQIHYQFLVTCCS